MPDDEYVMYILVNTSLKMSKGKWRKPRNNTGKKKREP